MIVTIEPYVGIVVTIILIWLAVSYIKDQQE